MRRTTYQPTATPATRMRVHWGRIAGATAVGIAGAAIIVAAWSAIPAQGADHGPDTTGGIGLCATAYSNDCAGDYLPASDTEPAPTPAPSQDGTLPPCESEDSRDCYWDAGERGNGEGVSFVDIDGTAYYPAATDDEVSQGGTGEVVNEDEELADGEIASGPVTEYDERTLICGTEAGVAIDTDIHGNVWAYCEPALAE